MSVWVEPTLALLSGIVVEALYALGVLFISERRPAVAGILSSVWGAAFIVGLNESFKTWVAALLWCVGLGVGTVLGMWIKGRTACEPGKMGG